MVDGRLPIRAELDERSLRSQQLHLLGFTGRDARLGRAQHDVEDGLQLVVDLLRAIRQEEVEVGGCDLGLEIALLLRQIGIRHRGVRLGDVGARAAFATEREVLAELHHDRHRGEVHRAVPELDHQHRVVERAGRRDRALRGAQPGGARLEIGVLVPRLSQQVGEAQGHRRGERKREHCRDHGRAFRWLREPGYTTGPVPLARTHRIGQVSDQQGSMGEKSRRAGWNGPQRTNGRRRQEGRQPDWRDHGKRHETRRNELTHSLQFGCAHRLQRPMFAAPFLPHRRPLGHLLL